MEKEDFYERRAGYKAAIQPMAILATTRPEADGVLSDGGSYTNNSEEEGIFNISIAEGLGDNKLYLIKEDRIHDYDYRDMLNSYSEMYNPDYISINNSVDVIEVSSIDEAIDLSNDIVNSLTDFDKLRLENVYVDEKDNHQNLDRIKGKIAEFDRDEIQNRILEVNEGYVDIAGIDGITNINDIKITTSDDYSLLNYLENLENINDIPNNVYHMRSEPDFNVDNRDYDASRITAIYEAVESGVDKVTESRPLRVSELAALNHVMVPEKFDNVRGASEFKDYIEPIIKPFDPELSKQENNKNIVLGAKRATGLMPFIEVGFNSAKGSLSEVVSKFSESESYSGPDNSIHGASNAGHKFDLSAMEAIDELHQATLAKFNRSKIPYAVGDAYKQYQEYKSRETQKDLSVEPVMGVNEPVKKNENKSNPKAKTKEADDGFSF